MNTQELQSQYLEAIKEYGDNYKLCSKECTKITLQTIVDKLTEINNRNKHQKYSDGYNSNVENEIEIITKQIEQL